ncbi:LIM domain-containing protein 1 isoform X1 [Poeciliopsis prolifica]|uniref:LIM domain-containing protein 1 isoform X1 n=1 Tax=Poeciliopsis prolifica TaxID=188132 RepID=UPI0024146416|nr:LIM domain-containing protein 1 isoform X1 [Poeciliopsis prolifica]
MEPRLCFGSCTRCGEAVFSAGGACKAMGHLFHNTCFTCSVCNKQLKGQPFFTVSGHIYCEDDFLFSGVHPSEETCYSCGSSITDLARIFLFTRMSSPLCKPSCLKQLKLHIQVLQARGKSYHPTCFHCVVCRQELQGQAFAVDSDCRVYCVTDYHRVQSPLCGACRKPILPTEGSAESIRVASCNKYYHVECYSGEVSLI